MKHTQSNFINYPSSLFKIFFILALTSQAIFSANAAFCTQYAKNAVQQYNTAKSTGMPIPPPAWNGNYNEHYNWCLIAPQNIAQNEHNKRAQAIKKYSAQSVAPQIATPPSSAVTNGLMQQKRPQGISKPPKKPLVIMPPIMGTIISIPDKQSSKSAPNIGTSFVGKYQKSDDWCLLRTQLGLARAGFTKDAIVSTSWSTASKGSYRALAECRDSRIVIVVAGPDKTEADRLKYIIRKNLDDITIIEKNRRKKLKKEYFPKQAAYANPKAPNISIIHTSIQSKCTKWAKSDLKKNGFTSDIFQGLNWVFASKGSYRGLIECTDGQTVIVVSGPDKNKCDQEKYKIRRTMLKIKSIFGPHGPLE